MERILETKGSVRSLLEAHLADKFPLSADALHALTDAILPVWEDEQQVVRTPGTSRLLIAHKRWVIRDDDLRLVDSVLDGLKASAGAGFFVPTLGPTPTAEIAAVVGMIVALVKVGQQILRKGMSLQPREYAILAALHHEMPTGMAEPELLNSLLKQANDWTTEELVRGLETLKEVPAKDGTKIVLVQRFPDGRWRTVGV